jgi:uncharacterized protein (TIGR03118 family)
MSRRVSRRSIAAAAAALTASAFAVSPAAAQPGHGGFAVHNLVSDVPGLADLTDATLVNPWGMAQAPTSPVWVADNGTNSATLYRGDGVVGPVMKLGLTVSLPGDGPTGQVFNPTTGFVVSDGAGHSGPAVFIFDTESGDVVGWNPAVPPPPPSTVAEVGAHVDGAIYKGLTMASVGGEPFLYAANFHAGTIDVFDSSFHLTDLDGSFSDPDLPKGYAPFNVAVLGGQIYVAYAVQDADAEDEVAGQGRGLVDVFDTSGHFIRRLVSHGQLDAPWGLALAPAGFGSFGGDLLVGNFGNGRINAYDPQSGEFQGKLRGEDHKPIAIDGLWALMFGNGTTADTSTLLFSAGIDDETHGLLGTIRTVS